MAWFQVASHLGIPVSELRDRITESEFEDWLLFIQQEEHRTTKVDHYLAQIAAEVRRTNVKNPSKVKLQDFLLKFKQAEPPVSRPSKEKVVGKPEGSKHIWASILKVDVTKKT